MSQWYWNEDVLRCQVLWGINRFSSKMHHKVAKFWKIQFCRDNSLSHKNSVTLDIYYLKNVITLKVQIFTGTYFRGDLFLRMGRILVLVLYFRALSNTFWLYFARFREKCDFAAIFFREWLKNSRNHENFYLQKCVPFL